jgi:hypothetical protein
MSGRCYCVPETHSFNFEKLPVEFGSENQSLCSSKTFSGLSVTILTQLCPQTLESLCENPGEIETSFWQD